jgi:glycerol-3-phosphate dehydrogenase
MVDGVHRGLGRRSDHLRKLNDFSFDLAIVGGGITGAGVALDAAARGLRVALVEKDDFASGTSSRSSKLVHGGLRYLAQYQFRVTRESLVERELLLRLAPIWSTPFRSSFPFTEVSARDCELQPASACTICWRGGRTPVVITDWRARTCGTWLRFSEMRLSRQPTSITIVAPMMLD